ncbi:hypothetical protein E4T80_02355 [Muribacter muris]|uniref:Phospholipase n=1 Tax=Muribacter muris TaxID=67855 RepID=A0A4Y9K7I0_9PAST|nr:hypothetical protein [Muribacter muris]TFV13070.1 hypothetical protein E4T80_02355 [Muribacter muris]
MTAKHKRDYCTGWKSAPSDINNCCHQHDRDYGKNRQVSRRDADRKLQKCMLKNGHPIKAWLFGKEREQQNDLEK